MFRQKWLPLNNNNNNNDNNDNNNNNDNVDLLVHGAAAGVGRRLLAAQGRVAYMRNLLGWLRLGWLEVPLIIYLSSLNYIYCK